MKRVHFRIRNLATRTTLVACQVGGMKMYNWRSSTWEKADVTCEHCKNTKLFRGTSTLPNLQPAKQPAKL